MNARVAPPTVADVLFDATATYHQLEQLQSRLEDVKNLAAAIDMLAPQLAGPVDSDECRILAAMVDQVARQAIIALEHCESAAATVHAVAYPRG